jgi:hypothetical protein
MPLSRYEQEVQINFNAESADAELYAASPVWIRKMILTDEEKKQRAENLKRARLHQNGGK